MDGYPNDVERTQLADLLKPCHWTCSVCGQTSSLQSALEISEKSLDPAACKNCTHVICGDCSVHAGNSNVQPIKGNTKAFVSWHQVIWPWICNECGTIQVLRPDGSKFNTKSAIFNGTKCVACRQKCSYNSICFVHRLTADVGKTSRSRKRSISQVSHVSQAGTGSLRTAANSIVGAAAKLGSIFTFGKHAEERSKSPSFSITPRPEMTNQTPRSNAPATPLWQKDNVQFDTQGRPSKFMEDLPGVAVPRPPVKKRRTESPPGASLQATPDMQRRKAVRSVNRGNSRRYSKAVSSAERMVFQTLNQTRLPKSLRIGYSGNVAYYPIFEEADEQPQAHSAIITAITEDDDDRPLISPVSPLTFYASPNISPIEEMDLDAPVTVSVDMTAYTNVQLPKTDSYVNPNAQDEAVAIANAMPPFLGFQDHTMQQDLGVDLDRVEYGEMVKRRLTDKRRY